MTRFHIFFVHSGTTEIAAARILDRLEKIGISKRNFLLATLRGYSFSLLYPSALNKLSLGFSSELSALAAYYRVPLILDCDYLHSPRKRLQYIRFLLAVSNIFEKLCINDFYVYSPHYRLLVPCLLSYLPFCRGVNIIEEGDLSYVFNNSSYEQQITVTRKRLFAHKLSLPLDYFLFSIASRGSIFNSKRTQDIYHLFRRMKLIYHGIQWFNVRPDLAKTFYCITKYAFLPFSQKIYLLSESKRELEFINDNKLPSNHSKLAIILFPAHMPLNSSSACFIGNLIETISDQLPDSLVVIRPHPDDLWRYEQIFTFFRAFVGNFLPFDYSQKLNYLPLDLIPKVTSNHTSIFSSLPASFVRYLLLQEFRHLSVYFF